MSTRILDPSPVGWHYAVRLAVAMVLSYPAWLIQNLATGTVVWIIGVLLWLLIFRLDRIVTRKLAAHHKH